MATRRPVNGRRVFVALDDVKPELRMRVAERLLPECKTLEERAMLQLAAVRPGRRPGGAPYGVWASKEDLMRVRVGLYPRRPKAPGG